MILKLRNSRLLKSAPKTYLKSAIAAAATSGDVLNSAGFTGTRKHVLFGEFGDENSEIVTYTSTTDADTIAFGAVSFDHPAGTPVYLVDANQVDFNRATTLTGSYSSLAKVAINCGSEFTIYEDTTNTTGFGKAQFWNTTATAAAYGTFYEIVAYTGNDRKTRGYVKRIALGRTNSIVDNRLITEEFLDDTVNDCDERLRFEKRNWKEEAKRLSVQTEVGITKYDLSSYLKDDVTPESILHVWIGGEECVPVSRDVFNREVAEAVTTTLAANVLTTDVTITLTDSSQFSDEGTITIEGDEISYTANDRATNVLSGVTGIDAAHNTTTAGGNTNEVWQGHDTGKPKVCTVVDGWLYTYPVIEEDEDELYLTIEYSEKYSHIDSDDDELAFPGFLFIDYLIAAIARKRGDADAREMKEDFQVGVIKHKVLDSSPVEKRLSPRLVVYPTSRRNRISS